MGGSEDDGELRDCVRGEIHNGTNEEKKEVT
jgi:hypothetical protein